MTEQGIADTELRATQIQSGAVPLDEAALPLGIPQTVERATHRQAEAEKWTIAQLLGQKKLVWTTTINKLTPTDKPIWAFQHTFRNVFNLHFRTLSPLFKMYSWKLHFTFQFRSNFQHVGQSLIVQHTIPARTLSYLLQSQAENWRPTGGELPKTDDPYIMYGAKNLYKSYTLMTMFPHTKVAMGEDVDVSATMDWNIPVQASFGTPVGYTIRPKTKQASTTPVVTPDPYDMGSIFLIVPFELQAASGVHDTLCVRIYSHLTDVRMGAYDPDDAII